jgi:NAD(P)-dependent dehydrogenase (short-subunit alcohol dehydrogenase family)
LAANGENIMLLENKNAVIYGAGGSVGGAVARAFVPEGARVFLTGLVDDGIEVACHGFLVERVDLRRLGRSAGG